MSAWKLLPTPPPILPPRAHSQFEAALAPLGPDVKATLHRVGIYGDTRVAYDAWSTVPSWTEAQVDEVAQTGLDELDLTRPAKRWRNRFVPSGRGHEVQAWFYDDQRLLGRVVIEDIRDIPRRRIAKANRALAKAWRALAEYSEDIEPGGMIITDVVGDLLAHDEAARSTLSQRPDLAGLIAVMVRTQTEDSLVLSRETSIAARLLAGRAPKWLVQLDAVTPVRMAPDAALTPTQRAVAEYAAVGATVDEIAVTLDAGRETVRSHLKEVYRRLDVANRVELARALS